MKTAVLLLTFVSNIVFCQSGHENLVNEIIAKYKQHRSISYDIDYMIKFFDSDEPFYVNTSVQSERVESDTIFKGRFLYSRKDSLLDVSKYYDSKHLFVLDHNKKTITRFNTSQGEIFPITGNADGNVINTYFLDIERFNKKIHSKEYIVQFQDSLSFVKVNIKFPDDEEYYGKEENIYLNKAKKTIDKVTFIAKYKDQVQRNHWMLSNIIFDGLKENELAYRVDEYFKKYNLEDYKPLTEKDYELLTNGSVIPRVKGKLYPNYDKEIDLKSDKLLIIDFWYTSCMPCIKAIPQLNQLQKTYINEIEIIGINSIEYTEKDKEKLTAFLKRTPIDYNILLIDKIPEEFNIRAFPTLYIIGKDGKVKYSKIGSSENLYDELETVLKNLLK